MADFTINNTTITVNTIWYVSPTGNDTTGNGTQSNPYLTYNKAVAMASNGDGIYMQAGYYVLTGGTNGGLLSGQPYSVVAFYASEKALTVWGDGKNTVCFFDGSATSSRDSAVFGHGSGGVSSKYKNCNFYNLNILYVPKGNSYTGAVFSLAPGVYKNIYIENVSVSTGMGLSYYNNQPADLFPYLENCQINSNGKIGSNYSGIMTMKNCLYQGPVSGFSITNSVSRANSSKDYLTLPTDCQNTGNATLFNVDGSRSHIGVNGGAFGWGSNIFEVKTSVADMAIGNLISCEYVSSTANTVGTFSNLGSATLSQIPTTGTTTPNGSFYFVKVDKGLLIADRVIQTAISWNTLNVASFIESIIFFPQYIFSLNGSLKSDNTTEMFTGTNPSYANARTGLGFAASISSHYMLSNAFHQSNAFSFGGWYKINPNTKSTAIYENYCGLIFSPIGGITGIGYGISTDGYYSLLYTAGSHNQVKSSVLATNDFVHLALTCANNTFKLYINGALAITRTVAGVLDAESKHFYSTYYNHAGLSYYRTITSVDEDVFIYGGTLTAEQIQNIYTNGTSGFASLPNPHRNGKIRALSGGTSYKNSTHFSTLNQDEGLFPSTNEWDSYVVSSNLNNLITPGDNLMWNWNTVTSNLSTMTTDTPHTTLGASGTRVIRGFGRARTFNGSSDRIACASPVLPNGTKTISFKLRCATFSNSIRICTTAVPGSDASELSIFFTSTGAVSYLIRKAGTTVVQCTSTITVCDRVWHDISFVQDDSNRTVAVYIDGTLNATANYVIGQFDNVTYSKNLLIGASYASATTYNLYLNGSLTSFKVDVENKPVLYFPMDEASGNVLDHSGNGYTGTSTGTTVIEYASLKGSAFPLTTAGVNGGAMGFRPVFVYEE